MGRDIRQLGRQHERALLDALDATAVDVQAAERREMQDSFDRPTPNTLRGVYVQRTKNRVPVAEVGLSRGLESSNRNRGPGRYLAPQIEGGSRRLKALEKLVGSLPSGKGDVTGLSSGGAFYLVPARFAKLDAYGNVSRGQIVQIMSQLRLFQGAESVSRNLVRRDGYQADGNTLRTAKKALQLRNAAFRRAGGQYFVVGPNARRGLAPGIYQRQVASRGLTGAPSPRPRPVFLFVDSVTYGQTFDFEAAARYEAERSFPRRLDEMLARHVRLGSA